jgi:3-hydroxybutyryl-CoA dehydrogenase
MNRSDTGMCTSDTEFEVAAVIGAGMMGPGIALTLALGGIRTTIVDLTLHDAMAGLERIRAQAHVLLTNELAEAAQAERALELLGASADLDVTVAHADLVIESVPENMNLKQDLFVRLDALAPTCAVLASNTSGLSITTIASRCAHPERILTAHFWNPPYLMPLVELVRGEKTSVDTAESVRQLLIRCGKTPVVVMKDRPGQLGNRLQEALVREAAHIVEEGIATVEDVDIAAKSGFGMRLPVYGILEHQDIVGLDMGLAILEYVSKDLYSEQDAPRYYRDMVARGDLGAKTGKGFYDWSVKNADEVRSRRDEFLLEFLKSRRRKGQGVSVAEGATQR